MSYQLQQTSQFKKDCKRMKKRGANMKELTDVIALLKSGQALPPEKRDHVLTGDYAGFR